MTPQIDTSDPQELKSLVRGTVHLPGGDGYDEARQVWNGMIDRRPAAIVCAAGVADVIATVQFASERGLPVAIRGGGHNVAGTAVGNGSIVIDLARLKSVQVDSAERRARAGGGVLWCEYDHETQAFGLASPGGAISTTGIAGLTLGGGYGYLSRRYGMACDNLVSADVVTASGELVTASADSNPDLFWALRGGGGNFGVVTAFEFQLHPVREPLGGMIVFPFELSKTVLQRFRDLSLEASDNLTLLAAVLPAPDGGKAVAVVLSDIGTEGEGERALQSFRELGSVLVDTVARMPYCALQQQVDVSYPKGQRHFWKSAFLKTLTDDIFDLMIETLSTSPSPRNLIMIEVYGGAVARVPTDATAFGHRDAMFNLSLLAISDDPAIDTEQTAWARDGWQKILPYSTGGAYVNYLSEGEDVHSAYSDARFQRLAAIKAQYDPANLFRFNQNIPPAKS
ncbi:FAD-binding oxidoreductase [Tunturiibacter gelidoferens]|uniref:FAD/FMN-containing dehydrogenase n=1 Tax=Tunturiibacter lichenicola TaxID=2051959 RepID=A0A7Y9NJF3_9BACT|nr:FAD-binding oxidoreductase [Edaphobacter lichenicola]NYF49913.1 FAD/FMN-containing dehydrogenase [Edaphobacter lichenicola]